MNNNYNSQVGLINKRIKELIGTYRDAIKHLDISESEFWIWYTLFAMEGEHTQQDICSIWSLPKQTVNTVITHMRLKRLAYLETVPKTRNRKIVRLTEEGKRYAEVLVLPITRAEEKAFERMAPDEIEAVNNVFGKYIEIIRGELNEATK